MLDNYLDTVTNKRTNAAQASKEQQELASMIAELKKVQLATMMGQSKPTVILTDQTDLGDKLKDMVAKFTSAVESTDTTSLSQDQIAQLKTIGSGLENLIKAVKANKTDNKDIIAAIKGLKLDVAAPIINVPEPNVTIQERKIDLAPLQKTIKEALAQKQAAPTLPDKIDLSRYRAQDLKDSGKNSQYVGFMNPEGDWYIIENDIKNNSMRYVFGHGDYTKAFKKAANYKYELLDEALNNASA